MRVVFGPMHSFSRAKLIPTVPAPSDAPAQGKSDPAVKIIALDEEAETVTFQADAYSPDVSNRLMKVGAYLVPEGVVPTADPFEFTSVTSPYAHSDYDTSNILDGSAFQVKLPDGPDGKFNLFTMLFYDI